MARVRVRLLKVALVVRALSWLLTASPTKTLLAMETVSEPMVVQRDPLDDREAVNVFPLRTRRSQRGMLDELPLVVWLVDASGPESPIEVDLQKLDNPAPGTELLAATTFEGRIVSPTPFALPVPLAKIDQGHDYRLKAAIIDQGKPVMATSNAPLVLTKGRPFQVDLEVSPIRGS